MHLLACSYHRCQICILDEGVIRQEIDVALTRNVETMTYIALCDPWVYLD
jgi:hypothetical protein